MAKKILAQLAIVSMLLVPTAIRADESRPNIVILLADDLGREDCGFTGAPRIKTPNLDRLAAAGAARRLLRAAVVQPHVRGSLNRTLPNALRSPGQRREALGTVWSTP